MWHRWQAKVVWKPHKKREPAPASPSVGLSPSRVVAIQTVLAGKAGEPKFPGQHEL